MARGGTMNLARPPLAAVSQAFRIWLALRRLLPRRKCRTFGVHRAEQAPGVGKIYVINLDREPGRWSKMEQELRHILDSSGSDLLSLTERHAAVDANAFSQEPPKEASLRAPRLATRTRKSIPSPVRPVVSLSPTSSTSTKRRGPSNSVTRGNGRMTRTAPSRP
jgi:hypothetical protein